jgi:hypothetical protein
MSHCTQNFESLKRPHPEVIYMLNLSVVMIKTPKEISLFIRKILQNGASTFLNNSSILPHVHRHAVIIKRRRVVERPPKELQELR